jgi:NTE family protein
MSGQEGDATAAPRIALVLGGGGARGLAHIGVLEVLEEEGLRPSFLVGSSMGGVVAALSAAGQPADRILELARGFRFPRWFIPGGLVTWDRIFAPAARSLVGLRFDQLALPVAVVAVDLEAGRQVVLHDGPLLPALRATCAVPGVLPPVEVDERWLVDGALVNALPVDVAAMADPDLVVAVRAGGHGPRSMPGLRRPRAVFSGIEILVRATEIALDRQNTLATAMVEPHVLVDVKLGGIGLRDFDRLDEAVAAGREAAREALPALRRALGDVKPVAATSERLTLQIDPVCDMVVSPHRAAAVVVQEGRAFYFCSATCRDTFLRRGGVRPASG